VNESITAPQENDLLKATREILEAHVTGRIIDLEDPDLSGVGGRIVHGVFVSLKRKGQLRSCCGLIGQPVRVLDALLQASERTALHDPRFAPIATCELPHLDCQIWILSKPEPVTRSGRSRIDAVIIGRHGLQIAVGDKRGILLPGVATDNGYDAETFLRQVSLKAGLEPEAWARIDARLWTFEGQVIEGPASTTEPTTLVSRKDPPLDRTTVEVYARYAADAIRAELGSQPRILHLGSTPSRSISGLILRFKGSGQLDLTRGQIVLNKGTDFHEMLESLIGQIVA